ncbi:cytochrome c biogenesis protein CcsA [Sulfurimonas sp.]|nr:cytochrome c biogenesis protein CcsA [Sulfurimonas sp.]
MKKLLSIIGSMKTMVTLMLIFAFSIGYATFVENDYGTITSKADIYNARWFELLQLLLIINLIYNMIQYKMFSIKKAPIFIFHLSFVIILIGAAITRFVGFEGVMHIREDATVNTMTSSDTYFKVEAKVGKESKSTSEMVYLSKRFTNSLSSSLEIDSKKVHVELKNYIPDAIDTIEEAKDGGVELIELMVTGGGAGKPVKISRGSYYENKLIAIDFESGKTFLRPTVLIYSKDDKLYMKHDMPISWLKMDDRSEGNLVPSKEDEFTTRTLFGANGSNFVLRKHYKHALSKIISNPEAKASRPEKDALVFDVTVGDKTKEVMIFGQPRSIGRESHTVINGVDVHLSYGAKELSLPFSIKLIDFQLDRYPGSMSPASYASEVILIDNEENLNMPYRIFMNNILEHRGYRFFQSSYDQDEKGTVLSVNNDPGTLPTYIGYFLLGLGMFWALFTKGNRFSKLSERARKSSEAKAMGLLVSLGLLFSVTPSYAEGVNPIVKDILSFDKVHADKFGTLIVQDSAGRMKPMDTLSTEILAKIHRGSSFSVGDISLTPNQVILGMMAKPDSYREVKIIRTKNEAVNKIIGAKIDDKYASFAQFFTEPNNLRGYKIANEVDSAVRKQPKHRDKFDKAILKIDERVNIAYSVYSGHLMQIWPKPNDLNNKWFPTVESLQTFSPEDAERIRKIAFEYFMSLDEASKTGDWTKPSAAVDKIHEYQKFYGSAVLPTESSVQAEIFYNKANIFERLYPIYLLLGFILLILSFTKILKPKFNLSLFSNISLGLLIALFVVHTIGLGIRWYISGHAPWSNGYESMIYISWATVLAGFIFSKRSAMTMASTAILSGLILFVAHLNWMDPQVTNLVPVLNSYWLSIHVAIITGSYGFLGLGALLGFVTILLFVLKNEKNDKHISYSIKELNAINEMSLIIGVFLLTFGNFLGGVWANESWGRYWGWDPKETWALVTILVYAVVIHLRFVKSLYTEFNFSVISLLSFTSVLMTYFGVNYYLAGMHSYAKGDPVPVPDFVPITYAIIFVVIALAFRNRKLAK